MNMNKVIIIGRLGRDPEIKTTQTEVVICNLSVATTSKYKDEEKTEWHRVVVFGKQAENCGEYLKSGQEVAVEGRIETRSWDDKETGAKRYSTEIVAQNVQFGAKAGAGKDVVKDAVKDAVADVGF